MYDKDLSNFSDDFQTGRHRCAFLAVQQDESEVHRVSAEPIQFGDP